jgi:hypothetical protein
MNRPRTQTRGLENPGPRVPEQIPENQETKERMKRRHAACTSPHKRKIALIFSNVAIPTNLIPLHPADLRLIPLWLPSMNV